MNLQKEIYTIVLCADLLLHTTIVGGLNELKAHSIDFYINQLVDVKLVSLVDRLRQVHSATMQLIEIMCVKKGNDW